MKIYYQTDEGNVLMCFKSDTNWYLTADLDMAGMAHLYIHINGNEYPLMTRNDLSAKFPEMDDERSLSYFNALIYEAFLQLKAGNDYIDMYEIEADLLPYYLDTDVDLFATEEEMEV